MIETGKASRAHSPVRDLTTAAPRPPEKVRTKVAVILGAGIILLSVMRGFQHFFDLGVYRGAIHYWLVDGGDLYAFLYSDSPFGFTYPPFAALVMSPLAVMSWPVAVGAAIAGNLIALVLVLRWFVAPIARDRRWPLWTACALAFCLLIAFEPVRATLRLGQVNLLLLVLVCFDQRILRGGNWAGVGIGIAAAIKLVPAVFIGYLIVSRQYRAAVVSAGTAAATTVLAFVVAPGQSRAFWTVAVWDTTRVGDLANLSNQSVRGLTARLGMGNTWWLIAVCLIMVVWLVRVRRASAAGDTHAGFALTGIVGCLLSPVTWVHHLVWLLPALFLTLHAGLTTTNPRRRLLRTGTFMVSFVVLSTKLTWWADGLGATGSKMYVYVSLLLLAATPIRPHSALSDPGLPRRSPAGQLARLLS